MNQSYNLAILGSYPPPQGGVSKHVERFCTHLRNMGVAYVVFNAVSSADNPAISVRSVARRRRRWFLWYVLTGVEEVVYVLSDRLFVWAGAAFMSRVRRKRVVIRIRNSSLDDWRRSSRIRYFIARACLRKVDGIVAVSHVLARSVQAAGVRRNRICVVPGFLPPVEENESPDLVEPGVWRFVLGHEPLIAANGRAGTMYKGAYLYGFDLIVDLAAKLRPTYPDLGIVICLWKHEGKRDEVALRALVERAEALGVSDAIYFNTVPGPLVPVIKSADLFVRPTNTDGDATSIREALFYGVPVVASDVTERPEEAFQFRNRNSEEFCEVVDSILSGQSRDRRAMDQSTSADVRRYLAFVLNEEVE